MKWWWFLFPTTMLFARNTSLSSDTAGFFDDRLTLTGHVEFTHPLGSFRAGQAIVEKTETEEETAIRSASFMDDVHIILDKDTSIDCDYARFDFQNLQASFSTNTEAGVRISHETFALKAKDISCTFVENTSHISSIKHLSATEDVELAVSNLYTIHANSAEYLTDDTFLTTAIGGTIKLSAPCTIQTPTETLHTDEILYDTGRKILVVQNLQGRLGGQYQINAHLTHFYTTENRIFFDEGVTLSPLELGTITTNGRVELVLDEYRSIDLITAQENTSVLFRNDCSLFSPAAFVLDPKTKHLTASSTDTTTLCFTTPQLQVHSGHFALDYLPESPLFSLAFTDHVKISSQSDVFPLQYAEASSVEYRESDHAFTICGTSEQPVFFYHHDNPLKILAQKLTITMDSETKKSRIEGEGPVYFSFPLNEKKRLYQLLHELSLSPL